MDKIKKFKFHHIVEGKFLSESEENSHIFYRHFIPKSWEGLIKKKIVHLIFQHGMIEYHERHFDFFEAICNQYKDEIVISTMDLVGHGMSGGSRGHIKSFSVFKNDFFHFLNLCRDEFYQDSQPETFIASHSLGGLIVIKTLADNENNLPFKINGLVFVNPCISPKIELPKTVVDSMDHLPDVLSKLRVPLIYNAYDLSEEPQKAIDFVSDPLISKAITINLGVETIKETRGISSLSYFFDTPSLFILSGEDVVVDIEKAKLFITGMDKSLVEVKFYQHAKHDILNETCRNDIFQEIITYIEKRRKIA